MGIYKYYSSPPCFHALAIASPCLSTTKHLLHLIIQHTQLTAILSRSIQSSTTKLPTQSPIREDRNALPHSPNHNLHAPKLCYCPPQKHRTPPPFPHPSQLTPPRASTLAVPCRTGPHHLMSAAPKARSAQLARKHTTAVMISASHASFGIWGSVCVLDFEK